VAKLRLFVGKGGVGKTTIAAAYAVDRAFERVGAPVLLISTDPAHSLSDIFQRPFGQRPTRVRLRRGHLKVWQVNAEQEFGAFLNARRKELLSILATGSIFSADKIEPFLDATLPGMAEMAALVAIHEAMASGQHAEIVVDTAPFGHTLRLFEMPANFQRFLAFLEFAASRDRVLAAHFGGTAKIAGEKLLVDWKTTVDRLVRILQEEAKIFLVTTPENFALQESFRWSQQLGKISPGLGIHSIVLNRAVLKSGACAACTERRNATVSANKLLRREFPGAKLEIAEDSGNPVLGTEQLRAFGAHVFRRKATGVEPSAPKSTPLRFARVRWPVLETPLSMVVGKGGVGKTTIAAGLGYCTRTTGKNPVEICSVDPAPSLDDVFQRKVEDEATAVLDDPEFRASEMDSVAIFQDWAERMKDRIDAATASERTKIHVDLWFERKLFEELLETVPPGLDEILAIFRILELLGEKSKRVVLDMAPTGHALDLLRTPERILGWTRLLLKSLATHRKLAIVQDAGVEVAALAHRVRDLVEKFGDRKSVRVYVVMLAEPLPDRETERLVEDLDRLNLTPRIIFVNRVVLPQDVQRCLRCRRRRAWQSATLGKLRKRDRKTEIYVVRNFPQEIAGKRGLRSFTSELWRME
jgi:arsenite/tail-anchored protein-transporting ATPase